jgi:hypothetical protein
LLEETIGSLSSAMIAAEIAAMQSEFDAALEELRIMGKLAAPCVN